MRDMTLILAACLLAAPALAGDLTGTASRIVDGDTLYLTDHYACPDYAVRRHGCTVRGRSYSRVVASCYLPDGSDLSCALIAAGARRTKHAGERYRECR